ncbi:MAG: isoprenylcysteine carboxylmethyltransferase family protein [Magnetococcales bacterium]|nr:isoprenylcysteine carboxylmethyltransferase family protein [Magnetococcales bacterium]MBF0155829.1 isoprenylcysteine carboxylmethyltransferase family protein [Magnetococcales bacterium]
MFERWNRNREPIGRALGFGIFGFFFLRQLAPGEWGGQFPESGEPLAIIRWLLISTLFFLFLLAYLLRRPAVSLANRPGEILLPLVAAPLPLVIVILGEYHAREPVVREFLHRLPVVSSLLDPWWIPRGSGYPGFGMMALGEGVTLAGMFWLGGSFSLLAEARLLVIRGPYRFVRHPLYAGELLSSWGYFLAVPSALSFGGAFLFTVLQGFRARLEEAKLEAFFPEYRHYRQRTGFLWPRILSRETRD